MLSNNMTEQMLSTYQSTYSSTYSEWRGFSPKAPTYELKPKQIVRKKLVKKDTCTLSEWRYNVPFSLFHKPKEIVRTHPNDVTQSFKKFTDTALEEVRRTRPRLLLTPALSLDDIGGDPKQRDALLADIYTSQTGKDFKETGPSSSCRTKPSLPPLPVPAQPVKVPTKDDMFVSPEWRKQSVSWDRRQIRGYCDPLKEFWSIRPAPECSACEESAVVQAHRQAKFL